MHPTGHRRDGGSDPSRPYFRTVNATVERSSSSRNRATAMHRRCAETDLVSASVARVAVLPTWGVYHRCYLEFAWPSPPTYGLAAVDVVLRVGPRLSHGVRCCGREVRLARCRFGPPGGRCRYRGHHACSRPTHRWPRTGCKDRDGDVGATPCDGGLSAGPAGTRPGAGRPGPVVGGAGDARPGHRDPSGGSPRQDGGAAGTRVGRQPHPPKPRRDRNHGGPQQARFTSERL